MAGVNDLSIVIPSYNRPGKLLATLKQLLPQVLDGVRIMVLDNCSQRPYQDYCVELDPQIEDYIANGSIAFVRHRCNIGMSANFMRGFESCESEWMWLVSDDDIIPENSVAVILDQIHLLRYRTDLAFVKFSSPGCAAKKEGHFIRSLGDLIDILAMSEVHFNSFIFISNGIYRISKFKEQMEVGYQFLHTYVPHLMMVLNYLNTHTHQEAVFLSERQIACYVRPEMGYSYGFVAGLGVGAFKNFAFDLSKQQYEKLESVFAAHNDFKVAIDLFYHAQTHSNPYVARRLIRNYYVQIKAARSILHGCLFRAFMLLLYMPNLFDRMVRALPFVAPALERHVAEIRKKYRQKSQPTAT